VHLIHPELHDESRLAGFLVYVGEIGENVTTVLPTGTQLLLGAAVEMTDLRNPDVA
jgi:hypothetical protein